MPERLKENVFAEKLSRIEKLTTFRESTFIHHLFRLYLRKRAFVKSDISFMTLQIYY